MRSVTTDFQNHLLAKSLVNFKTLIVKDPITFPIWCEFVWNTRSFRLLKDFTSDTSLWYDGIDRLIATLLYSVLVKNFLRSYEFFNSINFKKLKGGVIDPNGNHSRDTVHVASPTIWDHSITCNPTQVNAPAVAVPAHKSGGSWSYSKCSSASL